MALGKKQPWERVDPDVSRRYSVLQRIGRGCYGIVWEVARLQEYEKCPQEAERLALKKVTYAFRNAIDAQRSYREAAYLKAFDSHENILQLRDVLVAPNDQHVYIVTDLYDSDLQQAVAARALESVHKPMITYQVLRALKYMHSANIMHRDVKPSNVLLRCTGAAVLADFGWARASPEEVAELASPMTEYAATRWYRAPEMLLGGRMYTTSVDLWALACLAAEMHLGSALLPGTSTLDMLARLEDLLGKPFPRDIEAMEAPYASYALELLQDGPPAKPLEMMFAEAEVDDRVIDFLKLALQYNPRKRLTAVEALQHPYVGAFHNPDGEPSYHGVLRLPINDEELLSASQYRDQLYADFVGLEVSKMLGSDDGDQLTDCSDGDEV